MKNGKKIFILVETFLGLMVFVLVMFMFLEKNEKKQEKISVIIQNSDDSQWAAFKYGAKMAAADKKTEVFVVSTAGSLSVQEEENLIEREIANGASGIYRIRLSSSGIRGYRRRNRQNAGHESERNQAASRFSEIQY